MPRFHDNLTEEKFFLEWFGLLGRDIGTNRQPHRKYTDNPNEFLEHIKMCQSEHEEGEFYRPCWVSTQPTRPLLKQEVGEAMAIEKLFFDFDDDSKYCAICDSYVKKDDLVKETIEGVKKGGLCPKCKNKCVERPRKEVIAPEVLRFLRGIKAICKSEKEPFIPTPFIVETYKGYHIYFFLSEIFKFPPNLFEEAKELYELLERRLIDNTYKYDFLDTHLLGNLNSMARVPLTPHEKTGKLCEILDENLERTKVRSLEFYRTYGVPSNFVKRGIEILKARKAKEYKEKKETIKKLEKEVPNGNGDNVEFGHGIRPCFKVRMEKGEASHAMRLAWLSEIYYNGYNTKEKMLELCRETWSDFKENISRQQIEDYFSHERYLYHPYKCSTIRGKGWCLGFDECKRLRNLENTNKHE